jgi:hypothetical protein
MEETKMGLREAYKMVIKHQLELLEEEGEWNFDNKEELAEQLHEEIVLLEHIQDTVEDHLETFGENYDLF